MIKRFLNSRSKSITFAAFLLSFSAIVSAALGIIRDRLLAGKFGASAELDIYFAAFRIPDFVYGILVLGGVAVVFMPLFSEYFKKDEKEAWYFANNLLNCLWVLMVLICFTLFLFAPLIVNLITPGFSPEQKQLTVSLTRIMFLSPVFFGLASIFSGLLQYFNQFLVYSIAPLLYNLGIIIGIVFFYPVFGLRGLGYGVVLGAFVFWLLQIPAARMSGYKYQLLLNFRSPGLIRAIKQMIPRTIGAAAYQINLVIITAIASQLVEGSITIFNFSNNMQAFPVNLIGIPFALAAFPVLSQAWAAKAKEKFLDSFSSTFRQILFLIIPCSALLFVLRAQVVRLILGTGEYNWWATRLTAASLGVFSLGIIALAFIPLLVRAFYSFHDTKTPVFISLSAMLINILLCYLFVFLLGFHNGFENFIASILKLKGLGNIQVLGLPLALSLSAIIQVTLLLVFLKRRLLEIKLREICKSLEKIVYSTFFMSLLAYLTLVIVAQVFTSLSLEIDTFFELLIQTGLAALVGGTAYLLINYYFKSPELRTIKSSVINQFRKR